MAEAVPPPSVAPAPEALASPPPSIAPVAAASVEPAPATEDVSHPDDAKSTKRVRTSLGEAGDAASHDNKRVRKPNALYTAGYEVQSLTPKKLKEKPAASAPAPSPAEPTSAPVSRPDGHGPIILKRTKKVTEASPSAPPGGPDLAAAATPSPSHTTVPLPGTSPSPVGPDGERKPRRKDLILTPEQVKAQRLPKGYTLEVVTQETLVPKEKLSAESLPAKRERKKNAALEDYVAPEGRRKKREKDSSTEDEPEGPKRKAPSAPKVSKKERQERQKQILERLAAVEQQLSSYKPPAVAPAATPAEAAHVQPASGALVPSVSPAAAPVQLAVPHRQEDEVLSKRSHKPNSQLAEYDTGDAPIVEEPPAAPPVKPSYKIQRPKKPKPPKVEDTTFVGYSAPVTVSQGRSHRSQRRRRLRSTSPSESPVENVVLSAALRECQAILKEVMAHKHAWPFNQPVDPVAQNIPDYFDIIKHPMDFGTIQHHLAAGDYATIDEFNEDMQLVFRNAATYNAPGSDIVIMSEAVKEVFEGRLARLRRKLTGEVPAIVEETITELRHSMQAVKDELKKLRAEKKEQRKAAAAAGASVPALPTPATSEPKVEKPSRPKEDARPMTLEEKRGLSHAINNLSSEHLGTVVQIISERMPSLTRGAQGDEIEIDIDALDSATLRHLERYIRSSTKKSHHASAARWSDAPPPAAPAPGESGTSKKIRDVERRLKELNEKAATLSRIGAPPKKDALPPSSAPTAPGKADGGSSSSSSSSSSSDSSSSDSSDSESEKKPGQKAPSAPPTPESAPAPAAAAPAPTDSGVSEPAQPAALPPAAPAAEEPAAPTILPSAAATKEVVLQNIDSWTSLDSAAKAAPAGAPTGPASSALWDSFRSKEKQIKQREKEREEQEERLRKEREERDEERRREEERRRRLADEDEARKQKAEEEAELAAQREREQERLAAKLAREAETPRVDLNEQSKLMSLFEAEAAPSTRSPVSAAAPPVQLALKKDE